MTIKETIGKFHANQLKSELQKKMKLGASKATLEDAQKDMENYASGKFGLRPIPLGKDGKIWWVGDALVTDDELSDTLVGKVEGAMGTVMVTDENTEISGILKMTTVDGKIYYYDNLLILSTNINDLDATLLEEFVELELQ